MKVYVLVDMEGGSGIHSFSLQTNRDSYYYKVAKRFVTQDTNAAIEGALAAGADEIAVWDSHGSGTIDFELLDPRAKLIRGAGAYSPWGMDSSFDALFQVAQHSKARTSKGVLCHTYSSQDIIGMWLNGKEVGEMGIRAVIAGTFDISFVLETGDETACREAKKLVPEIETACVKWGYAQEAALMLHPKKSYNLIKEKATRAIKRVGEISPLKFGPPYELKVRYVQEQKAFLASSRTGVERVDSRTIVIRGDNLPELENSSLQII